MVQVNLPNNANNHKRRKQANISNSNELIIIKKAIKRNSN